MHEHVESVLISRQDLAERVAATAHQITDDLCRPVAGGGADRTDPAALTIIPILTGSIIFVADLIREIPLPMQIHLVSVTSYPERSTLSRGAKLRRDLTQLPASLDGTDVLIIDDILDTGRTLALVRELVAERNPRSLRTCVLLRKQLPGIDRVPVDYVCFDIPDAFVVGYGLDFNNCYRNLPDVVTLRPEIFATVEDPPIS